MKRIFVLFFIFVFCAVGCVAFLACDAKDDTPAPIRLQEGMRAEEIFDMLDRAYSYTIVAGDEDYRFSRSVGYTKLEEGVYDALFVDNGEGYRMTTRDGLKVEKVPVDTNFYNEINDVYDHYVQLLRDSFENMTSREPVKFDLGANGYKATIKIIMKKGEGDLSVFTCEISNLNCTELFFPDELKNYKSLADKG